MTVTDHHGNRVHPPADHAGPDAARDAGEPCVHQSKNIALFGGAAAHDRPLRARVDERFHRHAVDSEVNVEHDDLGEGLGRVLHRVLEAILHGLPLQQLGDFLLGRRVERVGVEEVDLALKGRGALCCCCCGGGGA